MNRVRCLVFNAALGPLDYRVPEGMDVGARQRRGRPAWAEANRRRWCGMRGIACPPSPVP